MNKLQAIAAMFDGATVMNPQLPNHVFFIDPKGKLPDIMVFERETKPQSISVDSIGSADGWEVVNHDFRRNVEAAAGPAAPQKSDLEHWLTDGTINEITGSWPSFEAQSHACKVVRMVVDKLGLQLPPPDAPVPTSEGPTGEVGPYARPEEDQAYYRRCRALELALEYNRLPNVAQSPDGIIGTAKSFEAYIKG